MQLEYGVQERAPRRARRKNAGMAPPAQPHYAQQAQQPQPLVAWQPVAMGGADTIWGGALPADQPACGAARQQADPFHGPAAGITGPSSAAARGWGSQGEHADGGPPTKRPRLTAAG